MTNVEPSAVGQRQSPRQRRRFRFRYGLRALCVVFVALNVGFGAIAILYHEARQQQVAALAIQRLGGRAFTTERYAFRPPDWIAERVGSDLFLTVFKVEMNNSKFGDNELAEFSRHLAQFSDLEVINLRNAAITDEGLQSLTTLPPTIDLGILYCPVSDAALKHLKHFTGSQEMWLVGTNISDAGAAHLAAELPKCAILFDADGNINRGQFDEHYKRRGQYRGH